MRLSELTKDQAVLLLDELEQALVLKKTKSAVVAFLASKKLCSVNSTGIENTLLKVGQGHSYVPPLFATLMKVSPMVDKKPHGWIDKGSGLPPVPQTQTTKVAGPTQQSEHRLVKKQPLFSMSGVNIRAISVVEIKDKKAKVYLRDGSIVDHCGITESVLSKNCTLLSLGR